MERISFLWIKQQVRFRHPQLPYGREVPKSTTAECPAATNSPEPAPHRHGAAGAGTGAPRGLPPFLGTIIQGETTNFALLSISILVFFNSEDQETTR